MSEKILIVQDSELQYVANVDGDKIVMSYSDDEAWSSHVRGQELGELIDDGNGVDIKIGQINTRMDYCEIAELYTLLEVKMKTDKNLMGAMQFLTDVETDFIVEKVKEDE